jgi:hypothetical protein
LGVCNPKKKQKKQGSAERKQSDWMIQLGDVYREEKRRNPKYTYKDAMQDLSRVWHPDDEITEKAYN